MTKKWKSRMRVEFEVEDFEYTVVIKLGNPLTFCELYDVGGELLAYGVSNCREVSGVGWTFSCTSNYNYYSPSHYSGYDPVKGAKLAFKSVLNKVFPASDPAFRDANREVRGIMWSAWKEVFMEEKNEA